MRIGVRCLILGLQLGACRALLCPPPYKNTLGVCVHHSPSKTSWCGAQKYCASIGGELVRGDTVLALIGKTFSGMPVHYWIGLTDFLNERRKRRDGWRWTDGSLEPASEKLPWASAVEPGNNENGKADCALQCYSTSKLCDVYCEHVFAQAMCQPRTKPGLGTVDVIQNDIRKLQITLTSEGNGCNKKTIKVDFFDCVVQCRATDMCASFYFHKTERTCILMLYTDANMDLASGVGWKKFRMK